ncbi:type II toxin-antitoxin system Phd/YefM family antitoxin [Legionella sp. 29fVS95]|uniref:type II toxin-antitoxin system Phd/YefM family antitoxin n=1 Tax=Legionella sp. 29fVS95 TaxID=3402813 RepID=UPI003AF695B6
MELKMEVLSYSALRSDLASVLDKVCEDHVSILITRKNGKPAVIMSLKILSYTKQQLI